MSSSAIGSPSLLAGRYELLETIGSGGMATVWKAFDRQLRRTVAVKVIAEGVRPDTNPRRRFEGEAHHSAALDHRNVVAVYDVGVDHGRPFLVMEWVPGPSLARVLAATGPMPPAAVASVASDALAGLQHAHDRGIVHRDVKPANILITVSGAAKLADFGIARTLTRTTELTAPGMLVGTAPYASPEQLGGQEVGPASDLYSLGCVLYECLSGRRPFEDDDVTRLILQQRFADPEPISARCPDVPPAMAAAVMRSLRKEPAARFGSAREMADALGVGSAPPAGRSPLDTPPLLAPVADTATLRAPMPAVSGVTAPGSFPTAPPVDTTASGRPPPVTRPHRRRRRLALAGLAALVSAAGIAGGLWAARSPTPPKPAATATATVMAPGSELEPGQSVRSPNGRFALIMGRHGNLATTTVGGGVQTWETGTASPGAYAIMQVDGNLVVYPPGKKAPLLDSPTTALWSSASSGHPGASLALSDNGNLEVQSRNGRLLWQSGAAPGSLGSELLSGAQMWPGQWLRSPDGRYQLLNDPASGTLRLEDRQSHCVLWHAPTVGASGAVAQMAGDGDFELVIPGGAGAAWSAGTATHAGASAVLQDTGALVVATAGGVTLWQDTPTACT